jgi:TetR/AcrR family transcriptional regulator, cholesterol catabolism regulator
VKKHSKLIPSMIKNERLIEQRREQIIEGAVRLFVEKGFHKTTTREIARECGLSIGTMYEYIQRRRSLSGL